MQCIGAIFYKLQLPPRARVHNVYHISILKKFEGVAPTQVVPLPALLNGRLVLTPESVMIGMKTVENGINSVIRFWIFFIANK
jgi:hypothetical protein